MPQSAEQRIACDLREILEPLSADALIEQSERFRQILVALEHYLPAVLREIHQEWKYESLDGILPIEARKTGVNEIQIVGVCILITDQTTTPIYIRLQLAEFEDEITRLECRVGQKVDGELKHLPYSSRVWRRQKDMWPDRMLLAATDDVDAIDRYYAVGFGERRV